MTEKKLGVLQMLIWLLLLSSSFELPPPNWQKFAAAKVDTKPTCSRRLESGAVNIVVDIIKLFWRKSRFTKKFVLMP